MEETEKRRVRKSRHYGLRLTLHTSRFTHHASRITNHALREVQAYAPSFSHSRLPT